jgi:hypothetical protein
MPIHIGRLIGLALGALLVAGCSTFQLRTSAQNFEVCDEALIAGVLARSQATGAGLADQASVVHPVIWPLGYSVRGALTGFELIDATGAKVASEGDRITASGGTDAQGAFVVCPAGSIQVERQPR